MTEVLIRSTLDPARAQAFLGWLAENVPELGGLSAPVVLRFGLLASLAVRANDFDAWRAQMIDLIDPDALDALAVAAVGILEPRLPGEVLPEPFATLLAAEERFSADGLDPVSLATFVVAEIIAGDDAIVTVEDLLGRSTPRNPLS